MILAVLLFCLSLIERKRGTLCADDELLWNEEMTTGRFVFVFLRRTLSRAEREREREISSVCSETKHTGAWVV